MEYDELLKEIEELRRERDENIFARDLETVKKFYTEERANTIEELGELFIKLRALGFDAVEAYEVAAAVKRKKLSPKAPEVGKVGYSTGKAELFTEDELDRLSKNDLKNPNVLKKAIKSMVKK